MSNETSSEEQAEERTPGLLEGLHPLEAAARIYGMLDVPKDVRDEGVRRYICLFLARHFPRNILPECASRALHQGLLDALTQYCRSAWWERCFAEEVEAVICWALRDIPARIHDNAATATDRGNP